MLCLFRYKTEPFLWLKQLEIVRTNVAIELITIRIIDGPRRIFISKMKKNQNTLPFSNKSKHFMPTVHRFLETYLFILNTVIHSACLQFQNERKTRLTVYREKTKLPSTICMCIVQHTQCVLFEKYSTLPVTIWKYTLVVVFFSRSASLHAIQFQVNDVFIQNEKLLYRLSTQFGCCWTIFLLVWAIELLHLNIICTFGKLAIVIQFTT